MHTHGAWIVCSGQGILCQHGGDERRLSLLARSLGAFWAQKNKRDVQIKVTQARFKI